MNASQSSSLVTVAIPRRMLAVSDRAAKRQRMTRAEFVRTALRRYLEEIEAVKVIEEYQEEKKTKKLKTLKGSLASLMG